MKDKLTAESVKDFLQKEVENGHPPMIVDWVDYPLSDVWQSIFKDTSRDFVWQQDIKNIEDKNWNMGIEINSGRNFLPIVMLSEKAFAFLKKEIYKVE